MSDISFSSRCKSERPRTTTVPVGALYHADTRRQRCVLPTIIYLQYRGSGSTLSITTVALFQSLAPRSWTFTSSRILSGTRRSVQTVSDVYL